MARIRTVKPSLFSHEVLFDLEQETGLPVRLAFIGLFTVADREGRFVWRPRTLKKDVLPHDDVDFSRVLDALATRGLVVKYRSGEEEYGYIPTFAKHQVINNRECASEIPSPCDCEIIDACRTRATRDTDLHVHAQGEEEGKGREREDSEEGKPSSGASAKLKSDRPPWWPKQDRYGRVVSDVTEKIVFDVGKAVLGKSAGGQVTRLRKLYRGDMRAVTDILLQAEEKSDPAEWIAGVIKRGDVDEITPTKSEIYPEFAY